MEKQLKKRQGRQVRQVSVYDFPYSERVGSSCLPCLTCLLRIGELNEVYPKHKQRLFFHNRKNSILDVLFTSGITLVELGDVSCVSLHTMIPCSPINSFRILGNKRKVYKGNTLELNINCFAI